MTATTVEFVLFNAALTSSNLPDLMRGTETHEPALSLTAQLVRYTQDEEVITGIIRAALPDHYSGNTLGEVPGMVRSAILKGFDRPGTNEREPKRDRPKRSEDALVLVDASSAMLFHTANHETYIELPLPGGGRRAHRVHSERTESWLRHQYYKAHGKPLAETSLKEVVDTLAAKAQFDGPKQSVHLRIGGVDDELFIDRGDDSGEFVRMTPVGWSLTKQCPLRFARSSSFAALPRPARGGSLLALKDLLGLDDGNWVFLVAFLLNCLNPLGPYLLLLIQGDQGTGKSIFSAFIKAIIDPNTIEKLRLPRSEHELMIQASENALLVFDNVSGVKFELSDAFCSLATGSGMSVRKLYTDDQSHTFTYYRPLIINGIGEYASRPDLLERSIPLVLPSIPAENRKTERELRSAFAAILPGVLGCLYDAVACALARRGSVTPPTSVRMADAAHWLVAAEPATGLPEGALLRALEQGQADMMLEKAIHDPVVLAIMQFMAIKSLTVFDGMVGELHQELDMRQMKYDRYFPATAAHLSNALRRLGPAMEKIGVHVEFGKKTRRGMPVRIWVDGDELPLIDPTSTPPDY